jgi:glycosyltransferase involved in cell wall biosynthesis
MEPEAHSRRAIAIFAHNEARNIVSCLESVKREIKAGDECYVLNNGSSDDTGTLVKSFSKDNGFCRLVEIEIGDKANAWNVFCHDLGVKAETFVFLDGDCRLEPGSLDALDSCLRRNPQANVAAALPDERSSKRNRAAMLKDGGLAGNLYAVPVRFMERIRQANVRFPAGLIGDDSLLGALAYWNLDPTGDWDMRRIAICADASFSYDRLSFFSMADVRLYYRRKIRYSLRYYQTRLMKKPLKALGLAAIPQSIDDVYMHSLPLLKLNWRGLDTWFDYLALKRIRKRMAEYPGEKVSRKSRQVEIT